MNDLRARISHLSPVKLAFAAQQLGSRLELLRAEPIAIIGMACRFPGGAGDPDSFWRLLQSGTDAIREVPADRWDIDEYYDPDPDAPGKMSCRYGGFLDRPDLFDADFFGISPREAVGMDPQQRLLLEVGWEAFEHANLPAEKIFGSATGVFVGISTFDYASVRMGLDVKGIDAYYVSGTVLSVAAGRLSYFLGLTGPCMSIDTACSSSLVGIHLACQSLRNRESSMALAGGVGLILAPGPSINFSRARMLARDGRCKTFDAAADGYVRGEGCGLVVLKRLSDAIADGDNVLALIRGSAVNQDGPSGGLTVPSGPSQEEVIRRAVSSGGLETHQVSYVEAHGTGTSLGDPIEVNALASSLCSDRGPDNPLVVGSVKTNIGHLEAAAGIAGLIKVVLSLQHKEIPPHLHFREPNPFIDWMSLPIEVSATGRKWMPACGRRIAGVSGFGFSGTNAHVVLEEAPAETEGISVNAGEHILTLSAKSRTALALLASRYVKHIGTREDQSIDSICYTANTCRSLFNYRLAVTASTREELLKKLESVSTGEKDNPGAYTETGSGRTRDLARQYIDGGIIDWDDYYRGQSHKKVSLPTYPFQRERFWPETEISGAGSASETGSAIAWPGRRLSLPMSREVRFDAFFSGNTPAFLEDHQLFGTVVVAGATYLSMLVQAAAETFHGETTVLEDVLFEQAITIGVDDSYNIQTVFTPDSQSFFSFHLLGLRTEEGGTGEWSRYVSGKIQSLKEVEAPLVSDFLSRKDAAWTGWEAVDAAALYDAISAAGHYLGRSFKWVRQIRLLGREAFCLLEPPASPYRYEDYSLYPGLLDSCFQLFCILGPGMSGAEGGSGEEEDSTYIPFSIGRMRFCGSPPPGRRVWCHSVVKGDDSIGRGIRGDIVLFDEDGRTILEITGFIARKLGRAHLLKGAEKRQDEWAYGIDWIPIIRQGEPASISDASVKHFHSGQAGMTEQAAPAGRWLILSDNNGVGDRLKTLLQASGEASILVSVASEFTMTTEGAYAINPLDPRQFERLLEECFDDQSPCRGIIHLWGLASGEETFQGSIDETERLGCGSLLYLLQALAIRGPELRPHLWLITRSARKVRSQESVLCPHQALLWGLGNVIRQEHPELKCTSIDLGSQEEGDQTLLMLEALRRPDNEDRIAFRRDTRFVERLVSKHLSGKKTFSLQDDATYLITGGLGALGLEAAKWMAGRGARNLVLVGRSDASDLAGKAVRELEGAGVNVRVLRADISKRGEVSKVMEEVRSGMPELKGIIHAAGLLDDAVVLRQNMGQFRRVLSPKVEGTWNLHEETRGLKLDFFVCFSSVASVLGSAGQSNYAAANAFMDTFVQERRRLGLPGLSINWGPWDMGMAAGLDSRGRDRIRAQGIQAIVPEKGFGILEQLLLQDESAGCVFPVNWNRYLQYHYSGDTPAFFEQVAQKAAGVSAKPEIISKLQKAPEDERLAILLDYVRKQVAQVLGEEVSDRIGPRQRLFDLGIDSLMAVELKNRLETGLEVPLRATLVFDYPTVGDLVDHLREELPFMGVPTVSPVKPDKTGIDNNALPSTDYGIDEIADLLAKELSVIEKEKI